VRIQRNDPDGIFYPVPGLYSQIVEASGADLIFIAGTLAYLPDGSLPETLAEQATAVLDNIRRSLDAARLEPSDVVKITIFTTDMQRFLTEVLDQVFSFFGDARPASTLVEISRLANPNMMLEIELFAARGKERADG